jgi:hypothetical protein
LGLAHIAQAKPPELMSTEELDDLNALQAELHPGAMNSPNGE